MFVGKRHRLIKFLEPVEEKMKIALGLATQTLCSPTVSNAHDLKVAIENVQYEIDKLAMRDANKRNARDPRK